MKQNRANKRQKKQKKRAQQGPSVSGDASALRIGPSSLSYLKTLLNPDRSISGVPTTPLLPSQKTHGWAKGTFTSGTSTGFIAFGPPLANDTDCVWQTGSTYALSVFDTQKHSGSYTTGVTATQLNLPYTTAQLAALDVQGRIVAACLKVRNVTARLSAQGDLYGLQTPDHDDIYNYDVAKLNQFEESARFSGVDQDTATLTYVPALKAGSSAASNNEADYLSIASPFQTGSGTYAILGFMVSSSVAQTYEWEAHVVVEYIGPKANSKTTTISDPVGYSAILNSFHSSPAALRPWKGSPEKRLEDTTLKVLNFMKQMSCVCCA